MSQLSLFVCAPGVRTETHDAGAREPAPESAARLDSMLAADSVPGAPEPHDKSAPSSAPNSVSSLGPAVAVEPAGLQHDTAQDELTQRRIVEALHARTRVDFTDALAPLLTGAERSALAAAQRWPHQLAHLYDRIVERLTARWSELNDWPIFARIVEPGQRIKAGLRACTAELVAPSRGLSGRVAFRVESDLRRVSQPIPPAVLESMHEHRGVFMYAFLEPIFTRRGGQVLRSLAEVRRLMCKPVDPLVVGWLGAGPPDYGLRFPTERSTPWARPRRVTHRNPRGSQVFLVGHWD